MRRGRPTYDPCTVKRLLRDAGRRATGVRDLFGIDTRSLAVLRVALALILLADLAIRASELEAFYTEDGVLPRALLADQVRARAPGLVPVLDLIPHLLFDGAFGQALLFVLAGLVAAALLAGWRTRWATIASWVLLTSLHARNPALRNGGDDIFRLLLFWSMFLPLGASWSVDARRRGGPSPPRLVTGGAPAALLLQVALIYVFNALYKDGAAWTTDFTALERFLANSVWGAPAGHRLLEYPGLLQAMTAVTITLERCGVLLAFCPLWNGPLRTAAVVLFAGFHAGILVFSTIDLFAVIGIAAWIPFLPAWFWTRAAAAAGRRGPPGGGVPRQPVPAPAGAVALALVVYVGFLNVVGLYGLFGKPAPPLLRAPALVLQIDQEWNMFSPQPAAWSRFLAARGDTAAGLPVDLLAGGTGRAADTDTLRPPSGRFAAERWRAYLRYVRRLPAEPRERLGGRLALYLGRQWNAARSPGDRVERVRLYRVDAPIRLAGDADPDRRRTRVRLLASAAVGGDEPASP